MLYAEGTPAASLLVLIHGKVECRAATDMGGGRCISPQTAFGLETLAGLDRPVPVPREESAMATQPCVVLLIPRTQLCSLMQHGSLREEAKGLLRKQVMHSAAQLPPVRSQTAIPTMCQSPTSGEVVRSVQFRA